MIYLNKYIALTGLLLLSWQIPAAAQHCNFNFLGTKTLYKAPAAEQAIAPFGYKPVLINYVGRHGARHLTKAPESSGIYKLVNQADSAHLLTAEGQKLKQMLIALQQVEKGNTKNISAEGKQELAGIADRMYSNNKNVFISAPPITVNFTKEVRTQQSAEAFLTGLLNRSHNNIKEQGINDTALRFYDLSPAYLTFEKSGSWVTAMAALKAQSKLKAINHAFTSRIFRPDFLTHISAAEQEALTADVFGFATIVYSLKAEIKNAGYQPAGLNFESLFNCDELTALARVDAAEDYLKKGPGTDAIGIQIKIAAPLLADFIQTTDSDLQTGATHVRLRFAHAETISPFATLLNLKPASNATAHITEYDKLWHSSDIIPLSANIQWILYKNAGGKILVKILLNEKPATIAGIKPQQSFYYAWSDLRKFYLKKLQQAGASLSSNKSEYLQNVK